MYSRKSWGGNTDPFILTKFIKPKNLKDGEDPLVSLVVFEWQDKDLIGHPLENSQYGEVGKQVQDWQKFGADEICIETVHMR